MDETYGVQPPPPSENLGAWMLSWLSLSQRAVAVVKEKLSITGCFAPLTREYLRSADKNGQCADG